MGFYNLDLDKLAEYTGETIEKLKEKSYVDLESMIKSMKKEKIIEQNKKNAQDDEYERLVLKYFEPVALLKHWFTEKEIVLACALSNVSERDLCEEMYTTCGRGCPWGNSEFIRTSVESIPKFDKQGRELMERARETVDVYRVKNKYQGLSHGKVVLYLLYERYPELAKFGFSAFEMHSDHDYEIYPKNGIYTSLTALLSGDIDWIIYRNREYCKWYNNGRYSEKECEKAFRTDEAQEMFALIQKIGKAEKAAGHSPITVNELGKMEDSHSLVESKVSESGNMKLLSEFISSSNPSKIRRFKLKPEGLYILDQLLNEYLKMIPPSKVAVHVCQMEDYFGEHGFDFDVQSDWFGRLPLCDKNGKNYAESMVCDTFGWIDGDRQDITVRVKFPE